jgi:hypothetical protein
MLSKFLRVFQRLITSAERDRIEDKFDRFDEKLDHFDERLDRVEKSQAEKNERLTAIYEITLANNEALEEKLNSSKVSAEMVRQIVDARIEGFQTSIKYLQSLIEQVLRRDCNLP